MEVKLVLLAFFLWQTAPGVYTYNERPIIGIVSEGAKAGESYIAASYVKFVESAGGRVVPILNDYNKEQITHLLNSVNGVLFPGGSASLVESGYEEVGKLVYQLAKTANDKGDYFPLWGTCLGFELLAVLQSNNDSDLSIVDAENYDIPLSLTEAASSSRLFSSFFGEEMEWISNEKITMNNHKLALATETFHSTASLSGFFTVLSTNRDRSGLEFVSTMEANKYPFYGVQWHPEKNNFEWTLKENTTHSYHAAAISQAAANFFVEEARKSNHKFVNSTEEYYSLIYNYQPVYNPAGDGFVQSYYFKI